MLSTIYTHIHTHIHTHTHTQCTHTHTHTHTHINVMPHLQLFPDPFDEEGPAVLPCVLHASTLHLIANTTNDILHLVTWRRSRGIPYNDYFTPAVYSNWPYTLLYVVETSTRVSWILSQHQRKGSLYTRSSTTLLYS